MSLRDPRVLGKLRDNRIYIVCPPTDALNEEEKISTAKTQEGDTIVLPELAGVYTPKWGPDLSDTTPYYSENILALTAAYREFVVVRVLKAKVPFFLLDKPVLVKVIKGELEEMGLLKSIMRKAKQDGSE